VQAVFSQDQAWYPGEVVKDHGDGTFEVRWDDPDGGPDSSACVIEEMQRIVVYRSYRPGELVEAVFADDGEFYRGTVDQANADGTFRVKWEEPDGGPEYSDVRPEDMKYPPIPLDQLEVGKMYSGTVTDTLSFGAVVDIGAEQQGLVHISCLSDGFVADVNDVVAPGQVVHVWVKAVTDDGKLKLAMSEKKLWRSSGGSSARVDVFPFVNLIFGDRLPGVVASIHEFGCFVTVEPPSGGPAAQGFVHLSEMSDRFIKNPWAAAEVGQEVSVVVKHVDVAAGRLSLSMKANPRWM